MPGSVSADEARRELTDIEEVTLLRENVTGLLEDAQRLDEVKPDAGAAARAEAALLQGLLNRPG